MKLIGYLLLVGNAMCVGAWFGWRWGWQGHSPPSGLAMIGCGIAIVLLVGLGLAERRVLESEAEETTERTEPTAES